MQYCNMCGASETLAALTLDGYCEDEELCEATYTAQFVYERLVPVRDF